MIKKGKTYHILIPNIEMVPYKIHIVHIEENHVMYKWYGKYKQWWHYCIDHIDILQIKIEQGTNFKKRKG